MLPQRPSRPGMRTFFCQIRMSSSGLPRERGHPGARGKASGLPRPGLKIRATMLGHGEGSVACDVAPPWCLIGHPSDMTCTFPLALPIHKVWYGCIRPYLLTTGDVCTVERTPLCHQQWLPTTTVPCITLGLRPFPALVVKG